MFVLFAPARGNVTSRSGPIVIGASRVARLPFYSLALDVEKHAVSTR
jgi:hypothetical protein